MADDIRLATLPHELAVADAELREALEKELARIGVPGSIGSLYKTFSRDVPRTAKWYVNEVFRIEGGRTEFVRRSMVLHTMMEEGTEFSEAWAELKQSVVRWNERRKQYYPGESINPSAGPLHVNVSRLARISDLPHTIVALEHVMHTIESLLQWLWWSRVFVKKLRRMKGAAEAVWQEAMRSESEGCRLLLFWGCDFSPYGADNEFRAFLDSTSDPESERLVSQWIARTTLERMNKARESMTAWVSTDGPVECTALPANWRQGDEHNNPPKPIEWLNGWAAISGFLKAEKDMIKSLNNRFDGPISMPAQGGQPLVDKSELVEWWNTLAILHEEKTNQRTGKRLSSKGHAFGKTGEAIPELGGGVKRRRTDKKS